MGGSKVLLGELRLLVCKYKLIIMPDPSQRNEGPNLWNRTSVGSRILVRRNVERAAGTVSTTGFDGQG